ncbi:hypothetical protein, partial [Schaalia canis]|uniref:hypothetical protein n=1 Tax=Schaalia canis TaxID=100469 RepID=UPI00196B7672
YPIDWGQVGKDTLFGLGGGAFGYGVGKGLQWAAKTPVGQAATQWVGDQAQRIPVVQHITNRLGARSAAETAESLTDDALNALTTPARTAPTPELPTPPVPPRPATIHFDGVDYPGVPEGAVGTLARKGKGMIYDIPPGTDGLHPSITSVRVMEPTHGKYPYPHGYAGYFRGKQPAHPGTGRTVDRSDPAWHIPLTPEQGWP